MKKYLIILLAGILFVSCDEYLDERPSKSTLLPLEKIEQLDALMGNFSYFIQENNRTALYGTEDWETSEELYHGYNGSTFKSMEIIQSSTWDVQYTPFDGSEYFWGNEYNKIFYANMVLHYLDAVEGSEQEKAELMAEAYLLKANSYMLLAETYCLPYTDATANELGITLKNSVSFEEDVKRSTLAETHAEIERCIAEALKSTTPVVQGGKYRPWRGSSAGAKGMAARYYLSRHDYQKALDYANAALNDYNVLFDYKTEMDFFTANVTVGGVLTPIDYPSTRQYSTSEIITYKEFLYTRVAYNRYGWNVPSARLMALYDQNADLRYKFNIVEDYSYTLDNTGISYPGYVTISSNYIPSGPTTSEMILIKAEAQARLGQWQNGMSTLETLRTKRIDAAQYSPLQASSQEDAVKKILEERRRERPFVFTWYDYRRYNTNEVAYDDIEPSRVFYPYTSSAVDDTKPLQTYKLSKNDPRWARPIPNTEIETSLGEIQQNSY